MASENDMHTKTVIQNARNVYSLSKKRQKTLFFKIVTGGMTDVISKVITVLKSSTERKDAELLHWLMGDDNVEVKRRGHLCEAILKGIIVVPLWVIITPVFYLLHATCNALLNSTFVFTLSSISKFDNLDFPLAFAVFSANNKMVELFFKHGISIDQKDRKGNNVFHYLADLSRSNQRSAEASYVMLKQLISREKLRELVLHSQNNDHYNPIEYATHFGSVQFALQMAEQTMQEEVLVVNNDSLTLSTDDQGNYISPSVDDTDEPDQGKSGNSEASCSSVTLDTPYKTQWTEKRMNVTMYEAFTRNGQCSFFLNLLISRSPLGISGPELSYLNNSKSLQKWMNHKFKQWVGFGILLAILELGVSLVFTLGVLQSTQGDFNLLPNRDRFINTHTQVFLGLWKGATTMDTYYNLSQSFFTEYSDIEASLSSGDDQMDYVELRSLINKLPGYTEFDSSDMLTLYTTYCVTGSIYTLVGDLLSIDNCTKQAAEDFIVYCREPGSKYNQYFVVTSLNEQIHEYAVATSFETQIYNTKLSVFRNTLRVELTRTEAYAMLFFVLGYSILYLFLDIFSRLRCLFKQLQNNISFYFLFATPVEGSYVKGQVNCLSLFSYLLIVCYYWTQLASFYGPLTNEEVILRDEFLTYDRSTADYVTINFVMCFFFVCFFTCRIILHLNFMKLWPWCGKFIITTFKLTVELLQFTVVYVIIVFFFASLFHFVTRSEDCPDYRDEENQFVVSSIFSTFALTFGHVDFSFQNNAVKMAYVLYVVMSVILLLNLIIALMGTTSSLITNKPWLPHLMNQAKVQETLGLESWVYRIFGCTTVKHFGLKTSGFIVEKKKNKEGETQVYVEVFEQNQAREKNTE